MQTTGWQSTRIRDAGMACLAVLAAAMLCQAASQVKPASVNPQFNVGGYRFFVVPDGYLVARNSGTGASQPPSR